MIVIVDYGMGNLHSVWKALKRIGFESKVSSNPADVLNAEKIILPGVGHFKSGMEHLRNLNLIDSLTQKVIVEKTPILGICLGMQLFTKHSEEGNAAGLGWFDANTVRFSFDNAHHSLRVPHMGWNNIKSAANNELFGNVSNDSVFYFVHSYHVVCNHPADVLATTSYGMNFVSAIRKNSIYGVQFHPEKSHEDGMGILKNFAERCNKEVVVV